MIDFIGKLLFKRVPEEIVSDDPQFLTSELSLPTPDDENLVVAQALVNHLNEILDWKDRVDAIDYIANDAALSAGNPTYSTTEETIINAIATIGGSGNNIDFELAKRAVGIVQNMFDVMAISSVTGMNNA